MQRYVILPLQLRICSPAENECYQQLRHKTFDCRVACTGLFADVRVIKRNPTFTNDIDGFDVESQEERFKVEQLFAQYGKYKTGFVENIHFQLESIYIAHSTRNYSK